TSADRGLKPQNFIPVLFYYFHFGLSGDQGKNVICMFLLICSGTDVISRRIYRRFSKGDFIVTATPTR
ncbi:hypothetical protein, partial [Escherichia coli]|uniref:hypothetical protein n=1 Tax=Escherichia coli TaxID=562 RepID=UPI001EDBBBB0